jgi:hypothetical protein
MHHLQANLAQGNAGLIEIEQYANACLPEDYDIVELLDDIIMAEYADMSDDGKSVIRNGIYLPESVIEQKAWRVGRVLLSGPRVTSKRLKTPGSYFIFPGDRGLRSIKKNGKHIIFINESRIFGVCEQPKQLKTDAVKRSNKKSK